MSDPSPAHGGWLDPERASPSRPPPRPDAGVAQRLAHAATVAWELAARLCRNLVPGLLLCESWRGIEPVSGMPLRVLYLGNGDNRAHLHALAFAAVPPPAPRVSCHWLRADAMLRRLRGDADLLLLDLGPPLLWWVGRRCGIRVPAWIKQKVAIADSWEALLAGLRRKTRREVKRLINKHGFRARIAAGADAGAHFYRELYRPYIEQRYREGATLVSEARFLRECRRGEVIELLQGERVVGAALLRRGGDELSVVWTGIAPDLDSDERGGVTDALDFFSLLYAYEQGCRQLSLGGSRADLQDGLLRYKRKWGACVQSGRVPGSLLRICPARDTAAVRGFLQRHSFIALTDDGKLVAKVWLGEQAPDGEQLQALHERYWTEGLARCELLYTTAAIPVMAANPQLVPRPCATPDSWSASWHCDDLC